MRKKYGTKKIFHQSFIQQVNEHRQLTGSTFEEAFFENYVDYLVENDEIIGEPNFLHFEMPLSRNQKACISGFAYNEFDGILYLMIVDDIDFFLMKFPLYYLPMLRDFIKGLETFYILKKFQSMVRSQNEAVNLAKSIYTRKKMIKNQFYELTSVKVFILTDKPLSRTF